MDLLRVTVASRAACGSTAVLVLLLAGSRSAEAQGYVLYQLPGSPTGDMLGSGVAGAGDVDGDGFDDFFVGAPGADGSAALFDSGRARVHSGANGSVLLEFVGAAPSERLGSAVARAGDVDGDGIGDFVVGARVTPFSVGLAKVFSGAGGALLFTFTGSSLGSGFGAAVAAVGDIDGDGLADVAIGEPNFAGGLFGGGLGRVLVFSGANGGVLLGFTGAAPGDGLGASVAGPGDLDGDGVPDVFVGKPRPPAPFGVNQPGEAILFSGATGATVLSFSGAAAGDQFGTSVAVAGDLDGDSVADLVVGAPTLSALASTGYARVFSGAAGSILYTLTAASPGGLGRSVAGAGDVDGDGVPDVVVGCVPSGQPGGQATVFSGASGSVLFAVAVSTGFSFGSSVAGAGDVNDDGFPDVVVGAPVAASQAGEARVLSYTGVPAGSSTFGTGCPGSGGFAPRITTAGGLPAVGQPNFRLYGSRMLGGSLVVLIFGVSSTSWVGVPLPLNLGFLGLPSCALFVSADVLLPATASGSGPGAGAAYRLVPAPPNPALSGLSVFYQWFAVDPGPLPLPGAMSEALQVLIP
ncbi:MAG TPA: FG-GAP-like repeat-containing protein [Planctomycetota bacterium]|jgi:hypothetical protein|nr:FG-GAP-like repeat-containing protein [Planctomycetota bacterium]